MPALPPQPRTLSGLQPSTKTVTSSVTIPRCLDVVLKPHQREAIHFLWKRLVDDGLLPAAAGCRLQRVEDQQAAYGKVFGAVLGHSMGLGKTLSTLAMVMLLQQKLYDMITAAKARVDDPTSPPYVNCPRLRVLVITPQSCIPHWEQSVLEWVRSDVTGSDVQMPLFVPHLERGGGSQPHHLAVLPMLERFYRQGGFLVLGYEEHRLLLSKLDEDRVTRHLAPRDVPMYNCVSSLIDHIRPVPEPMQVRGGAVAYQRILRNVDVIVLDESHRLKHINTKTVSELVGKNMRGIPLRIALTGTPIQNHMEEYATMVDVVTGTRTDLRSFRDNFVKPIEFGQCVDATLHEFSKMQRCVLHLREFFSRVVHRCGVEVLEATLPPRFEVILFVELSGPQEQLYHQLLQRTRLYKSPMLLYHKAVEICTHSVLATHPEGGEADSCEDHSDAESTSASSSSASSTSLSNRGRRYRRRRRRSRERNQHRKDRGRGDHQHGRRAPPQLRTHTIGSGVRLQPDEISRANLADSPKLELAMNIVRGALSRGEKVVIFASYVRVLQLMQYFLQQQRMPSFLLTGDTKLDERKTMMQRFRFAAPGVGPQVFLCSTKAGGVGINLLPANHCILLNTSWNPADDSQATFRTYRYGQTKPTYVYRLCTYGTAEHVVFHYALRKEWLHRKVADVRDPSRRESHMQSHFLRYPCDLPLAGWVLNDAMGEHSPAVRNSIMGLLRKGRDGSSSSGPSAVAASSSGAIGSGDGSTVNPPLLTQKGPSQRSEFAELLRLCCPTVAELSQSSRYHIVAAVEHSFLMRDNTDEIIGELNTQLEERALRASRLRNAVVEPSKLLPVPPLRESDSAQVSGQPATLETEPELLALFACVSRYVLERNPSLGMPAARFERLFAAWNSFLPSNVTSTETAYYAVDSDSAGTLRDPLDVLTMLSYRYGCATFLDTIRLRQNDFFVNLQVRCRRLDPRREVKEVLSRKGATLWKCIPPSEVTKHLTECYFTRGFAEEMICQGTMKLLHEAHRSADVTDARRRAFAVLVQETYGLSLSVDSCAGRATTEVDLAGSHLPSESWAFLAEQLEQLLSSLWPKYQSLTPAPIHNEALADKLRPIQRVAQERLGHNPRGRGPKRGVGAARVAEHRERVFSQAEVAVLLQLPRDGNAVLCSKCTSGKMRYRVRDAAIADSSVTLRGNEGTVPSPQTSALATLECDCCGLRADHALLDDAALRGEVLLEMWTLGLVTLADMDVSRTFDAQRDALGSSTGPRQSRIGLATSFHRGHFSRNDPGAAFGSPACLEIPERAFHVLPRALFALGVHVLTRELPTTPVMLLALQCGVRGVDALSDRLLHYGTYLWSSCVFPKVKEKIKACCSSFRTGSDYQHQSAPEMFVLLALQFLATRVVTSTLDVLLPESFLLDNDGPSSDNGTQEDGDGDGNGGELRADSGSSSRCGFGSRAQQLFVLREVFFAVAYARYTALLDVTPVPPGLDSGRNAGKRPRDASRQMDFMPWKSDPARRAMRRGGDHRRDDDDGESDTSSSVSSSSGSMWSLTSDIETKTAPVHAWGSPVDRDAGHAVVGTDAAIATHRKTLFWQCLIEVFGFGVVKIPLWVEKGAGELVEPVMLVPPPDVEKNSELAALSPMAAVDTFFQLMRHRAEAIAMVAP